jgi:hypothetical protein
MDDRRRCLQTGLRAAAIATVILCAQHETLLVATENTSSPKAQWNDTGTLELLIFLQEQEAEAGDRGNYNMPTFNAVADHIKLYRTRGPDNLSAYL